MKMLGLARVGNDPEVKYTTAGKPLMEVSLACNYGQKKDNKTQWIKATMWGERAEKVKPYITKGQLLFVTLSDIHVEQYKKKDGTEGVSLCANLNELEFTGRDEAKEEPNEEPQQPPSFAELNSDIPF